MRCNLLSSVNTLNKWFVIHDLLSLNQHPDMIGNRPKGESVLVPSSRKFGEIQKGDRLIYYIKKQFLVAGIYEVISDMTYLENDKYWNDVFVYKIHPVYKAQKGLFLNFKKFLFNKEVKLDIFPDKKKWGSYLMGKVVRKISDSDFNVINQGIQMNGYLTKEIKHINKIERNQITSRWKYSRKNLKY
jgi:hypothetical protein